MTTADLIQQTLRKPPFFPRQGFCGGPGNPPQKLSIPAVFVDTRLPTLAPYVLPSSVINVNGVLGVTCVTLTEVAELKKEDGHFQVTHQEGDFHLPCSISRLTFDFDGTLLGLVGSVGSKSEPQEARPIGPIGRIGGTEQVRQQAFLATVAAYYARSGLAVINNEEQYQDFATNVYCAKFFPKIQGKPEWLMARIIARELLNDGNTALLDEVAKRSPIFRLFEDDKNGPPIPMLTGERLIRCLKSGWLTYGGIAKLLNLTEQTLKEQVASLKKESSEPNCGTPVDFTAYEAAVKLELGKTMSSHPSLAASNAILQGVSGGIIDPRYVLNAAGGLVRIEWLRQAKHYLEEGRQRSMEILKLVPGIERLIRTAISAGKEIRLCSAGDGAFIRLCLSFSQLKDLSLTNSVFANNYPRVEPKPGPGLHSLSLIAGAVPEQPLDPSCVAIFEDSPAGAVSASICGLYFENERWNAALSQDDIPQAQRRGCRVQLPGLVIVSPSQDPQATVEAINTELLRQASWLRDNNIPRRIIVLNASTKPGFESVTL